MRSYILIPALAALNWEATPVAASTKNPNSVARSLASTNPGATNNHLFKHEIIPRQYRAEDWTSSPQGPEQFASGHGAGKRSLGRAKNSNPVARSLAPTNPAVTNDRLFKHEIIPRQYRAEDWTSSPQGHETFASSHGAGKRSLGWNEAVKRTEDGGNRADGVCSSRGGTLEKGKKGEAKDGGPGPIKVQGSGTRSAGTSTQGGKTRDGGGSSCGGSSQGGPGPNKAQGNGTHRTKGGKTQGGATDGVSGSSEGGPGPVKVKGGRTHGAKGGKTAGGSPPGEGARGVCAGSKPGRKTGSGRSQGGGMRGVCAK